MRIADLRILPLSLGLLLAAGACAWSVPADPGLNASRRGQPASPPTSSPSARLAADPDPQAGAIYARRCAQCHELLPPSHLRASEWPAAVAKYGPRAGLFGAERRRVLTWLQGLAPR